MIETLRIFATGKKEEKYIEVDESLAAEGSWIGQREKIKESEIKVLDYASSKFEYYIKEDRDGVHWIYRKRRV